MNRDDAAAERLQHLNAVYRTVRGKRGYFGVEGAGVEVEDWRMHGQREEMRVAFFLFQKLIYPCACHPELRCLHPELYGIQPCRVHGGKYFRCLVWVEEHAGCFERVHVMGLYAGI